jgi:Flp pilus assembly protein TadD
MVGLELQKIFDDDGARMHFERAVERDPDYTEALNNLANIYSKSGKRDRALELLRRAVAIAPEGLSYRSNLAITYFSSGMLDNAEYEYNIIIQIAPQSPEATFARLMLYEIRKAASGK